jgi:hypothetical protein
MTKPTTWKYNARGDYATIRANRKQRNFDRISGDQVVVQLRRMRGRTSIEVDRRYGQQTWTWTDALYPPHGINRHVTILRNEYVVATLCAMRPLSIGISIIFAMCVWIAENVKTTNQFPKTISAPCRDAAYKRKCLMQVSSCVRSILWRSFYISVHAIRRSHSFR